MSIIGRIGANQITYPYVKCDVKDCIREQIIEGVTTVNGQVIGDGKAYAYPRGWASVSIVTHGNEIHYDCCSSSHAARLFARKLQEALG